MLKVGDEAPRFDVRSSDGRALRLEDFRGKKNVVLYFYPRDFTSVCTTETCGFRDMYDELVAGDTEVIGSSFDDDDSHRRFAARYGVRFPLVADPDRRLATSYGAVSLLRNLMGRSSRVTFVIDKAGRIREIVKAELSASAHLDGVKAALARLR